MHFDETISIDCEKKPMIYKTTTMLLICMGVFQFSHAMAQELTVEQWLRQSAVTLDPAPKDLGPIGKLLNYRVIGLGEATHGQHEFFDIKRRITMQLIRDQKVRLVAYEASATRARAASEYIAGKSDDRIKAVKALGMMIWQIEENAQLLDDLRAWNLRAGPNDQVRLIGIDAQDSESVIQRLTSLLSQEKPQLAKRVAEVADQTQTAVNELMTGNRTKWKVAEDSLDMFCAELRAHPPAGLPQAEYETLVREFRHAVSLYVSNSNRDFAMADLFLAQLEQAGEDTKCVLWAHNAHVQRSPMLYLGTPDLAMGGHIAAKLGEQYYAIGFAFGEGEFQANAQVDGKWGFRTYRLSQAPPNSLEEPLGRIERDAYLIPLRNAPDSKAVQEWLHQGHGQRWFGGYAVRDDYDAIARDASKLVPTTPAKDFDALLYIQKTTAAQPLDKSLIWPAR